MDQLWYELKSKILETRDRFIPQRNIGPPLWKRKGDVPIDQELQNLIKNKKRLHRKWIETKTDRPGGAEWRSYAKLETRSRTK